MERGLEKEGQVPGGGAGLLHMPAAYSLTGWWEAGGGGVGGAGWGCASESISERQGMGDAPCQTGRVHGLATLGLGLQETS